MRFNLPSKALFVAAACFLRFGDLAYGQSATAINGLYYTGANNSGGLLAGAATDSHWSVSYARVGGAEDSDSEGAAYVVSSTANTGGAHNYIDSGWVQNTSTAQWITARGARTTATGNSSTEDHGGDYLPGNGTSGTNSAYYVYQLAFTIAGSGTGNVTNQVSITMTIAADDQYTIYVNPASAPTVSGTGVISAGGTAASGSGLSAWDNTSSIALQDNMGANNATFKIGINYLYVVVANTNNKTGNQTGTGSTDRNASGLLVYQVYGDMTIDGRVVPEVGTWMPVVLALGLFVRRRFFGRPAAVA